MTPEAQRMAILQVLGWKREFNGDHEDPEWYWIPPGDPDGSAEPPDVLNDLNAMHEAEKVLLRGFDPVNIDTLPKAWDTYTFFLAHITALGIQDHATAAQRAEAFLRTIGKWVEE